MRLVLATQNPHKVVELGAALPGWTVEALGRAELPPETGASYRENALAKARFARAHAPAAAWGAGEDSGIEVVALGGAPGIRSARWASDGVARMLEELTGHEERSARYVCALAAIGPDGREVVTEGILVGTIATAPRGHEGFGYDPIFVPEGEMATTAELGDAWKRRHSHRARAAAALAAALGTDS
ncbi:MAG: non-canonical purine NTP pyrophosphatase [Thermoleophilia bacterium]|nr:non-canonical purine NTP pyrophosphatase [Thermoleophilia bacterium]